MKRLFVAVVPLVIGDCSQPLAIPDTGPLTKAATPFVAHPAPSGPAIGYTARPITEPGDWRQLNDAQSPGGSS